MVSDAAVVDDKMQILWSFGESCSTNRRAELCMYKQRLLVFATNEYLRFSVVVLGKAIARSSLAYSLQLNTM
jgi:hypothetical protein